MNDTGAAPDVKLRKKYIRNAGLIFLLTVILLTFFSRTINNLLMPEVEYRKPMSGRLETEIKARGVVKALDTEIIYARGNWTVTEVIAEEGAEVTGGNVLAIVEAGDVKLDLKSKELELIKLENALEQYRGSFDEGASQNELDRLSRATDKAQKELESVRALYESGAETQAAVEQAQEALEIAKQAQETGVKEFARQKEDYARTLKEKESELELKRLEYENFKNKVPEDGKIIAPAGGVIKTAAIEKGATLNEGQVIFELIKKGSPVTVEWMLNAEKADKIIAGDSVIFSPVSDNSFQIKGTIKEKRYSFKDGMYEFISDAGTEGDRLADGQEIAVSIVKRSESFPCVVPNTSIVKQGGESCVFVLNEREGPLGKENYVELVKVRVEDSDDFNSAISGLVDSGDSVVTFSTKALADGIRVKTR